GADGAGAAAAGRADPRAGKSLAARLSRPFLLQTRERRELVLQFQIALEPFRRDLSLRNRGLHRAARLDAMLAVGEVASGSERVDFVERFAHALAGIPQLQLAHARRIDHQSSIRQHHELTMRRRVTPARIGGAYFARLLNVRADEAIDDGALADAGRTEQGG